MIRRAFATLLILASGCGPEDRVDDAHGRNPDQPGTFGTEDPPPDTSGIPWQIRLYGPTNPFLLDYEDEQDVEGPLPGEDTGDFRGGGEGSPNSPAGESQFDHFAEITPIGQSFVEGQVWMGVGGEVLFIDLALRGLFPGAWHVMYLHRGIEGEAVCPPSLRDVDGDGQLRAEDGRATFGAPLVPIDSIITDHNGGYDYDVALIGLGDELPPLGDLALVVYGGATPDGSYDPELPVACGALDFLANDPTTPAHVDDDPYQEGHGRNDDVQFDPAPGPTTP